MNEVVNEVTKYSKLGHPRSTVKDTSPWEIAALGCDKWPMEDCIGDHGDHLRYKCWAKYVFLWQLCILTKKSLVALVNASCSSASLVALVNTVQQSN